MVPLDSLDPTAPLHPPQNLSGTAVEGSGGRGVGGWGGGGGVGGRVGTVDVANGRYTWGCRRLKRVSRPSSDWNRSFVRLRWRSRCSAGPTIGMTSSIRNTKRWSG